MLKSLFAALLALTLTAGCADKTSHEALLEQASMAIDKADYASAVAILEGLCPDETACSDEVLALLAQARMGLSGVDTFSLLTAFDTGGAGSTFVFNTLDAMFGTGGVTLDDVTRLQDAITSLQNVDQPTAADNLDLALAAAAHLVASIRFAADPGYTGTWKAPAGVELTALTAAINADLVLVQNNVAAVEAALGQPSTLTTQIDQMIADLTGAGALPVTEVQVAAYIGTL